LIVDDDELLLTAMSRLLTKAGYDVLSATAPRPALEIVRTTPLIDVLVSDIGMPEMPGTELVSEVARISPQTARLLITGGPVDLRNVPDGVPVLRKPVSTEELLAAVQDALDRSAQVRDDLARNCHKSAELRCDGRRLRQECREQVRQLARTIQKSRIVAARQQAKLDPGQV
jgi:response regulator RpfG family c-di-GMP phosphodiesterase